jgi:cysteine desulfurase
MLMESDEIYLDNHATTRCDPRVVAAMLPLLTGDYGNPHSITHQTGRRAAELTTQHLSSLASCFGASAEEIVITSGATESNNLAFLGCLQHPRNRRRHLITVQTEHPSVLDPVARLEQMGFEITRLPVIAQGAPNAGQIDLNHLESAIRDDTALVSIMLANNEIGVIQPLEQISLLCHRHEILVHTDAAQAVGRLPINVNQLGVDLLSFSAHKFYGPKGIGGLYVRQSGGRRVRLLPQIVGGGQQRNLRSGTMNPAAIVAMSTALHLCCEEREQEMLRLEKLRNKLWLRLRAEIPDLQINGPSLDAHWRLTNNLNLCFPRVEGESLMMAASRIAISSGSACSSAEAKPSSVLLALGLEESAARRSLRFGLGRFNTEQEIDLAATLLVDAYQKLARFLD